MDGLDQQPHQPGLLGGIEVIPGRFEIDGLLGDDVGIAPRRRFPKPGAGSRKPVGARLLGGAAHDHGVGEVMADVEGDLRLDFSCGNAPHLAGGVALPEGGRAEVVAVPFAVALLRVATAAPEARRERLQPSQ